MAMHLTITLKLDHEKLEDLLPHIEQALVEDLLTSDEAAKLIVDECYQIETNG